MTGPTTSRVLHADTVGSDHTKIPNALIRDPSLSAGAFRVLSWLASQAETHAIHRTVMARELSAGRTTLNRWIQEAQLSPYLTVLPNGADRRGNTTYVYRLVLQPTPRGHRQQRRAVG